MTIDVLFEEVQLLFTLIDSIKEIDLVYIEIKDTYGNALIID